MSTERLSVKQEATLRELLRQLAEWAEEYPEIKAALAGWPKLDTACDLALRLLEEFGVDHRTLNVEGSAATYPVTVAPRLKVHRLHCPCPHSRKAGAICYHSIMALAVLIKDPGDERDGEDVFARFDGENERDRAVS